MPVEMIEANPKVPNLCGRVAVMRGPLAFCAEGIDNPDLPLRDIRLCMDSAFVVSMEEICGRRLSVLTGKASVRKDFDELYRICRAEEEDAAVKMIPYFAWANRGITEMNVWFIRR
jgi:hypothetical protein